MTLASQPPTLPLLSPGLYDRFSALLSSREPACSCLHSAPLYEVKAQCLASQGRTNETWVEQGKETSRQKRVLQNSDACRARVCEATKKKRKSAKVHVSLLKSCFKNKGPAAKQIQTPDRQQSSLFEPTACDISDTLVCIPLSQSCTLRQPTSQAALGRIFFLCLVTELGSAPCVKRHCGVDQVTREQHNEPSRRLDGPQPRQVNLTTASQPLASHLQFLLQWRPSMLHSRASFDPDQTANGYQSLSLQPTCRNCDPHEPQR